MITEPGFGSDALNMQTSFSERDGLFHLTGKKHWAGLTGMADFWILTARRETATEGNLMRDIDMFISDEKGYRQKIVVEEYFENLGLYQIPYVRYKTGSAPFSLSCHLIPLPPSPEREGGKSVLG